MASVSQFFSSICRATLLCAVGPIAFRLIMFQWVQTNMITAKQNLLSCICCPTRLWLMQDLTDRKPHLWKLILLKKIISTCNILCCSEEIFSPWGAEHMVLSVRYQFSVLKKRYITCQHLPGMVKLFEIITIMHYLWCYHALINDNVVQPTK